MTQILRVSLLMCTAANSQRSKLEITKAELDSFYEWLEGPEFGSHPTHRIPLHRLKTAEREVWRKICLKVHEKTTLRAALQEVRGDHLFWTPLLLAHQDTSSQPYTVGKGKGKRLQRRWDQRWD